jgi:hypothetical protein
MKTSEHFALNQWLTDYPQNWSYDTILVELQQGHNDYVHDRITVWEVAEYHTLDQVAELIEDTRKAFERATQGVTA